MPAGTEFLEPISPQYRGPGSWGAIGARTTESQIHRQLASGLSMPVGFKNGTDGGLQVALDACRRRRPPVLPRHRAQGRAALVATSGNPDTHVILRGGRPGPNYSARDVAAASVNWPEAANRGWSSMPAMPTAVKVTTARPRWRWKSGPQLEAGRLGPPIAGIMLESFLRGGAQNLIAEAAGNALLAYGQSVTDACMDWDVTVTVLEQPGPQLTPAPAGCRNAGNWSINASGTFTLATWTTRVSVTRLNDGLGILPPVELSRGKDGGSYG